MKKIIYIETPKGSFVKRNENLEVDFVSPLPCPFNYGHVKGEIGGDGDPMDALLLGKRRMQGAEIVATLVGCVRFLDKGLPDDKWIFCVSDFPSAFDKWKIKHFFQIYAQVKRISTRSTDRSCQTELLSIEYYRAL